MFTAKELIGSNIMSVIEPTGSIRKTFFWLPDEDNKKLCQKLNKKSAFIYAKQFLPAFGFYKYRENDQEEGPFLIVQKMGRRVRILGNEKDIQVQDRIFETIWSHCLADFGAVFRSSCSALTANNDVPAPTRKVEP